MTELTLNITGMSCGHCLASVRRALEQVEGVTIEELSLGKAKVKFDAAHTSPNAITEAIEDIGYEAYASP